MGKTTEFVASLLQSEAIAASSLHADSGTDESRGDNFAWKPDIYYDGDIADTDAVRAWITSVVLKPALKRH